MKRRIKLAALLAIIWLLAGCSQNLPDSAYPLEEYTKQRASRQLEEGRWRAEPFTQELCVVSGNEPSLDASVSAEAAALFSESDRQTLLQKNVFERLYPASITKIMTALIALKNGNLADQVTVGEEAVITEAGASLCDIHPGDTLTLEQLLYGLMLPSGNDAAAAIAVHIAGSEEAFAELMNEEARRLAAVHTHFVNPHGLHNEEHYTTAYDLYLIMHEAMKQPEFRKVIGTVEYTAQYTDASGAAVIRTWKNSNQYLTGACRLPEGMEVIGGKTGTTKAAGFCLILASMDQEGNEYISVILKSDSREHLYEGMSLLFR